MRYAGQGYEITLPCPARAEDRGASAALRKAFDDAAQEPVRPYGAGRAGRDRLLSRARRRPVPPVALPKFKPKGGTLPTRCAKRARCAFDGETLDCPVYQRERLDVGLSLAGPAILDQFDCTTVICAGPDRAGRRVEEPDRDGGKMILKSSMTQNRCHRSAKADDPVISTAGALGYWIIRLRG